MSTDCRSEPTTTLKVHEILFFQKIDRFRMRLGYHNRVNTRLPRKHPNVWTLIKSLQIEENRFCHLLIQITADPWNRIKSEITTAVQERLDKLYSRYNDGETDAQGLLD